MESPPETPESGLYAKLEAPAEADYPPETPEAEPLEEPEGLAEEVSLPTAPAKSPLEEHEEHDINETTNEPDLSNVADHDINEAMIESDLLNVADIPEGTFLPSTPELHYLEEHADLLEEHGFSDEELEPLAAAAAQSPGASRIDDEPTEMEQATSMGVEDDTESTTSTAESFHTLDSGDREAEETQITDAIPIAETNEALRLRDRQHRRDISEITVSASA